MANFLKGYGDTEGPLGIPMKSALAKEVEALLKGLPAECKELGLRHVSKLPANMRLEEGERADISLITANTMDADSELVLPTGLNWDRFRKAGMPVTWCHNYSQLPVGRAAWVKRQKADGLDGWLAKTLYAKCPVGWKGDWFADAVWDMVQQKIIKGKSIGFIPTKARLPNEKEKEKMPALRWVFEECTILEYAVCPIQSNPDAVVEEVSKCLAKGLHVPSVILEDLGLVVPEDTPDIDPAFLDSVCPTTQKATPPSPTSSPEPQAPALKAFTTMEEWSKAVVAGVTKRLEAVDVSQLVQDELDRRRGRI